MRHKKSAIFRDPEGMAYHGAAVGYSLVACSLGIVGLFDERSFVNAGATLLLAHGMTIAAYMVHECAHNTVFRKKTDNARLGRFMMWVCGASYGTFEDARYKHLRHHSDNDDVVWFDYERFFREHPLLLRVIQVLEWFYIPAHDLLMHFIMVFTSFVIPKRRNQRTHNVTVIAIRGAVFCALLFFAPKVAILYAIAFMGMMTILRFMDSLQHDYEYNLTLFSQTAGPRNGDREFEQEHTFSNPHALPHTRLNWLTLNFGFHNAHHEKASIPWYRLPALHIELYGEGPTNVIPLWPQLVIFHRHRVRRIVGESRDSGAIDREAWGREFLEAARLGRVAGGNAASFLTSF